MIVEIFYGVTSGLMSAACCGCEDDFVIGKELFKFFEDRRGGDYFADGHGVNPDALAIFSGFDREVSRALFPVGLFFSLPGANQHPRHPDGKEEGEEDVVEDEHERVLAYVLLWLQRSFASLRMTHSTLAAFVTQGQGLNTHRFASQHSTCDAFISFQIFLARLLNNIAREFWPRRKFVPTALL